MQGKTFPASISSLAETSTVVEGALFSGKKFVLLGFGREDESCIRGLIEEYAGNVLPQQSKAIGDYAVVPLLGCKVKSTVGEVVTNTWLVSANPRRVPRIHEPIIINDPDNSFSGLVVFYSYSHRLLLP